MAEAGRSWYISGKYEPKTQSNADSDIGDFGDLGGGNGRLCDGAAGQDDGG